MRMKRESLCGRALIVMLLFSMTFINTGTAHAGVPWHLLERNPDGTVRPAPGYVWDGDPTKPGFGYQVKIRRDLRAVRWDAQGRAVMFMPRPGYLWNNADPNDLATRLRPGLVLVSVGVDGTHTFRPAPGYVWNGNPRQNDFAVRVRSDLRVARYDESGTAVRFYPAPGYEWDGDPNRLVVRVHRGLQLEGGTFHLRQGYDWVDPYDAHDLRVHTCDVIAGMWTVTTADLSPMIVEQEGCHFRAGFWSGDGSVLHEISGKVGSNQRMTVIRRTSTCSTELYGNVFLGDSGLWWTIDGTSGGCGVGGHRETRLFARVSTFQNTAGPLPWILGKLFQELVKKGAGAATKDRLDDGTHDMTHEPGMGPNPAAVGGGGARPMSMMRGN